LINKVIDKVYAASAGNSTGIFKDHPVNDTNISVSPVMESRMSIGISLTSLEFFTGYLRYKYQH
jgi:hypothetical protein